jgi:hypothetical protein
MTQFLTENPYYVDPYGFQGDALIYREAAGVLSNPLDRDTSAWRRLGWAAYLAVASC